MLIDDLRVVADILVTSVYALMLLYCWLETAPEKPRKQEFRKAAPNVWRRV